KELLALTARRWKSLNGSSTSDNDPYIDSHGSPPWLATTFNLTYELSQFAVYFQVLIFNCPPDFIFVYLFFC
ncbi:unnamed protein product, partial [Rotaria socialis]